mgnify:CR=1 FL=1
MKKYLSISLIFLLTIVITYAGSGINAYSFCCDVCYTVGVEAITSNACYDIHQDECTREENNSGNTTSSESSHEECSIERLDINTENISFETNQSKLSIKVLNTLFSTLPYLSNEEIEVKKATGFITQTQKPPNLSKNDYFSLLETLII